MDRTIRDQFVVRLYVLGDLHPGVAEPGHARRDDRRDLEHSLVHPDCPEIRTAWQEIRELKGRTKKGNQYESRRHSSLLFR